jgi:tetratricopeptide (TPR) repeat protein
MLHAMRTLIRLTGRHPGGMLLVLAALLGLVGGAACAVVWALGQRPAAEDALARDDLEGARRHLAWCLRFWPRDPAVHLLAARLARRQDAFEESARHLAECQRLHGVTAESALEWTLLRAQQGDLADEDPLLSRVEQDRPEAPLILEALVEGYLAASRLPEAHTTVDRLLARRPDHFRAHLWRGIIAEGLGRPEDARAEYAKALALDPASDEARRRLAGILTTLGSTREAAAHYDVLRRRRGDEPETLLGLARCRIDAHELEEARELLDTLLARRPEDVAALVERGRVAFLSEGTPAAVAWLRRAVDSGPHDLQAHRLLLLYLDANNDQEGAEACRAALRAIEADRTRSAVLIQQARDSPHDPAVRCELGALLLRNGLEAQALHWLAAALKEDPTYGPAHAALADYYERIGRPDLAAAHRAGP